MRRKRLRLLMFFFMSKEECNGVGIIFNESVSRVILVAQTNSIQHMPYTELHKAVNEGQSMKGQGRWSASICQDMEELVVVVAGNPDRPIDGITTIEMLLTLVKANTAAGYPGVSTADEGRDPDYISLTCLGTRQRFRCGGAFDGQMYLM
eukprot:Gb_04392 [translate_table: standard]